MEEKRSSFLFVDKDPATRGGGGGGGHLMPNIFRE